MNIYCSSDGTIFHVDTERIYQGSAGVNVVRFIGRFPSNAQVLVSYKLPNGALTGPKILTPIAEIEEIKSANGGIFSVWETVIGATPRIGSDKKPLTEIDDKGNVKTVYDLDYTITENYGVVEMQFFVYPAGETLTIDQQIYNVYGGCLATASTTFTVEKGVPITAPTIEELTTTDGERLIGDILGIVSSYATEVENQNKKINDEFENQNKKINDIEQLAVSKSYAFSIDNYSELYILHIFDENGKGIISDYPDRERIYVGQDLFVKTPNVPDLWVSGIGTPFVDFEYTTDEDFVEKLIKDGSVKIGYIEVSPLEGKTDLKGYVKDTERDNFVKGGITDNAEELTDEEKTSACEWLGAVKKVTSTGFRRVYAVNSSGEQSILIISGEKADIVEKRIPLYRPAGNPEEWKQTNAPSATIPVCNPVDDYDATNKKYVDGNFVRAVIPSEKNVYYIPALSLNNDGKVVYWSIKGTPDPSGEKVVIRSKQGRAQMQDPVEEMDISNKRYVDGKVGEVETALDSIIAIQNALIGGGV